MWEGREEEREYERGETTLSIGPPLPPCFEAGSLLFLPLTCVLKTYWILLCPSPVLQELQMFAASSERGILLAGGGRRFEICIQLALSKWCRQQYHGFKWEGNYKAGTIGLIKKKRWAPQAKKKSHLAGFWESTTLNL